MKCHHCQNETFTEKRFRDSMTLAGVEFTAELPSLACDACGESSIHGDDLMRFENAVALEVVRRGLRAPDAIKFLRKSIGRASDLAELLHVTADTVSRWERGAVDIDNAAFAVLGALVVERLSNRTEMQDRLRAINAPVREPHVEVVAA